MHDATITTTINKRHTCPAAANHLSHANVLNTHVRVKFYDLYTHATFAAVCKIRNINILSLGAADRKVFLLAAKIRDKINHV